MTVLSKLEELSAKTDRQLVQLASNKLDFGIRTALEALTSAEEGNGLSASLAYAEAISLIRLLRQPERSLESKLARLHKMLQTIASIGSIASPSEDAVADLARAIWEARGCPDGVPEDDWFRAEKALKSRTAAFAVCAGR